MSARYDDGVLISPVTRLQRATGPNNRAIKVCSLHSGDPARTFIRRLETIVRERKREIPGKIFTLKENAAGRENSLQSHRALPQNIDELLSQV